jgi:hypothetical protein
VDLGRCEGLVNDLVGDLGQVLARERLLAGQEFVENHSQGEKVTPAVHGFAGDLLG